MYIIKMLHKGKTNFLRYKKKDRNPVLTEQQERALTFEYLASAQNIRDDILHPHFNLSKVSIVRLNSSMG